MDRPDISPPPHTGASEVDAALVAVGGTEDEPTDPVVALRGLSDRLTAILNEAHAQAEATPIEQHRPR